MERALLEQLAGAVYTIDAALYDLNRDSVVSALLDAQGRGADVRAVTDNEVRASSGSKAAYDALEAAGILVVSDGLVPATTSDWLAFTDGEAGSQTIDAEMQSGLMHDKYFVIDGLHVWTGSTNASDTDLTLNHNNALLIESEEVAAIYAADFAQMVGGTFGTLKNPSVTSTVVISGAVTEIYFSPQDQAMARIIEAVNEAKESVEFAIFYFTHAGLRDALLAAHLSGVEVRGIWDQLGASNGDSQDEALCFAGIPIVREESAGKMHHKFMVIDADGASPLVISGSLNWTAAGTQINNENTVILRDAGVAAAFSDEFSKLWAGVNALACVDSGNSARVWLPLTARDARIPAPSAPPVRIHKIVYDPPGVDAEGEYVAIVNAGEETQNLAGWVLKDAASNRYEFGSAYLSAGASLRIWVRSGEDTATELFWGTGRAIWNNDGDTAVLLNSLGEAVDTCSYPGGGVEHICSPFP